MKDFRDAEADILVHSIHEIVENLNENTMNSNLALRALCKKNGFHVEVIPFFSWIYLSIVIIYLF